MSPPPLGTAQARALLRGLQDAFTAVDKAVNALDAANTTVPLPAEVRRARVNAELLRQRFRRLLDGAQGAYGRLADEPAG